MVRPLFADQNQRIHDEHRDQNRPPDRTRATPCAPAGRTRRSNHPAASRPADLCAAPPTLLRPPQPPDRGAAPRQTLRHGTQHARSAASFARFLERRGSCRSRRYDRGDGGRLQRPPRLPGRVAERCRSLHAQPARRLQPGRGAAPGRRQTHPFRHVYTGVDRTRKQAVGSDLMARLGKLDLPPGSLCASRATSFFSASARAAWPSWTSPTCAKPTSGATASATSAAKTGQPITIRIEPCIRSILDRYRSSAADTPYVFPILTATDAPAAYASTSRPSTTTTGGSDASPPCCTRPRPHLLHSPPQLGHRGAQPRHPAFGHQRGPGPHLRTDHADLPPPR